jgi:hypothetical protein
MAGRREPLLRQSVDLKHRKLGCITRMYTWCLTAVMSKSPLFPLFRKTRLTQARRPFGRIVGSTKWK